MKPVLVPPEGLLFTAVSVPRGTRSSSIPDGTRVQSEVCVFLPGGGTMQRDPPAPQGTCREREIAGTYCPQHFWTFFLSRRSTSESRGIYQRLLFLPIWG